uniref:Uncharacterized protein n=1 Tax=Solanum lycopersicum TaxID=4081 RepID=A0A3Q7HL70_SOLLC
MYLFYSQFLYSSYFILEYSDNRLPIQPDNLCSSVDESDTNKSIYIMNKVIVMSHNIVDYLFENMMGEQLPQISNVL